MEQLPPTRDRSQGTVPEPLQFFVLPPSTADTVLGDGRGRLQRNAPPGSSGGKLPRGRGRGRAGRGHVTDRTKRYERV